MATTGRGVAFVRQDGPVRATRSHRPTDVALAGVEHKPPISVFQRASAIRLVNWGDPTRDATMTVFPQTTVCGTIR